MLRFFAVKTKTLYFLVFKEGVSSPVCLSQTALITVLYLKHWNGFVIIAGNKSQTPVTSATLSFIVTALELKDISSGSSRDVIVIISPQVLDSPHTLLPSDPDSSICLEM